MLALVEHELTVLLLRSNSLFDFLRVSTFDNISSENENYIKIICTQLMLRDGLLW